MLNIPKFGRITTDMRDTLHWLPMRRRITFKICMLVRNCVNGSAPIYLQEICNSVRTDAHRPRLRTTDLLTTVTWLCRSPTLTDSVGAVFLCPGRTSGTIYHLTFGKCPINQNNLLERFYFQTALTSTSEDNVERRAIAKTSTSTSICKYPKVEKFVSKGLPLWLPDCAITKYHSSAAKCAERSHTAGEV